MKKVIQVEMRRAFESRTTKAALIIGMLISIFHIFHNFGPLIESMKHLEYFLNRGVTYPIQVFDEWICGNTYNLEGFLYFMILPIIAVLPYGDSYYNDLNSGFLINIYARCKRSDYLVAKYIAVFVSAGTVFVIPLILNMAAASTLLPSLRPQNIAGTFINTSVIWYTIYENHPYIYVLLYLVIDFIFAGLIACLALTISFYTEKRLIVLISPFIIYVFIYSLCGMAGDPKLMGYSPTYFLFAGYGSASEGIFILFGLFFFLTGGIWFFLKGKKTDIL